MKRRKVLAEDADKYALYQVSVQNPEASVHHLSRFYRDAYGGSPRVLREDFCGGAAVSCAWVESQKEREAWGVDIDDEPIMWGLINNVLPMERHHNARIRLVHADARTARTPPADVVAAQNYSWFIFRTRADLLTYFRSAHRNLDSKGLLVLDMMGGGALQTESCVESRRVGRFTYVWDQLAFNPRTHEAIFHIHFRFPDGSMMRRAFEYPWRIWTMPEVHELLDEAGFRKTHVYWGVRDSRSGDLVYRQLKVPTPDPSWLAYVVAVK
ncbi:MAG: class I SAM-dependent methyltransferase [Myxococcota bacterium]